MADPDPPSLNLLGDNSTEKGWPWNWGWGWWNNKDKNDEQGKEDDDFKEDEDNAGDDDGAAEGGEEEGSGESGGSGEDGGSDDDAGGDAEEDPASDEPANPVPASEAVEEDSGVWVASVNEKRAMHGACSLEWATPLAEGIKEWVDGLTSLEHADSYHIPPPGGPCGENLAWGSNGITPIVAVEMWYNEVNNCQQLPGCEEPLPGTMTGHFTAMVWKGARTMGCAISANGNYAGCRWKAGDTLSEDTPNMAMPGLYERNVGAEGETATGC